MTWQCSENHEWVANLDNIKNKGSWCPNCAGMTKHTIEDCHDQAKTKGGLCLSTEYVNIKVNMTWQCSQGHKWNATLNNVQHGTWCPCCGTYKSEELCRDIFERNLMEKFPNTRPKFMKGLELDGYNAELNIAFEYNGIQHYEYVPFFHNNDPERFESQKERDRKKYRLCRENNINLIIIPYQYSYKNPEELEEFIMAELWKIS
jgi:hypothetical protein